MRIYNQVRKLIGVSGLNEIQFDAKNPPQNLKLCSINFSIIKIDDTPICVSIEDETMVITSSQQW